MFTLIFQTQFYGLFNRLSVKYFDLSFFQAVHHKWLRRMLNISWKDMVRNESIRELTNEKLQLSVQERRLRWLGHGQRMSDDRIAEQVLHWILFGYRKKEDKNFAVANITHQLRTQYVEGIYDNPVTLTSR